MGDIKFRVWHEKYHRHSEGICEWDIQGDSLAYHHDTDESGCGLCSTFPTSELTFELFVFQDNGPEVYVNDIVQIGDSLFVVADKHFEYVHGNDCERFGYKVLGTDHDPALHMIYIGDDSDLKGILNA